MVIKTRTVASSAGEHLGQVHQHPRRRAPDVSVFVWQHEKDSPAPLEDALGAAMIGPVEDVGERHLEDLGYLKRVGDERKGGYDDTDDRGNFEPGSGNISVEPADHSYVIGGQTDFLLGLAQRGGDRVGVACLDAAAG